jgi:hypothetical protein
MQSLSFRKRVLGKVLRNWIFVLSACASLLASSVSACTCSHHQLHPEHTSCHEHSESKSFVGNHDCGADCIEETCICPAKEPIVATKADKRTPDLKNFPPPNAAPLTLETKNQIVLTDTASEYRAHQYISKSGHRLLPSRAPPRL